MRKLGASDFTSICSYLQPVGLRERTVLHLPEKPIEYIYFIETGLVSLRTVTRGSILETATVGRQGAVGALIVVGAEASIHHSVVTVPGSAFRLRLADLQDLMTACPSVREHLLDYVRALVIHGSQTALCGIHHDLEQRLACWLSVACDTLDGEILPLTHDHLSTTLGLRRPSLTESLIRFEAQRLIRKSRGFIQVVDRNLLREKACDCYAVIANAYPLQNRCAPSTDMSASNKLPAT